MRARRRASSGDPDEANGKTEDGHYLLGGSKWHHPKPFHPNECAVPGCTRVLDPDRRTNPLADLPDVDAGDPESGTDPVV